MFMSVCTCVTFSSQVKKNVRVYFVDDTFRLISVGEATSCEQFRALINERVNLPEGFSELFAIYEVEKGKRKRVRCLFVVKGVLPGFRRLSLIRCSCAERCVDASENVSSLMAADYNGDDNKNAVRFLFKKKVFLK